MKFNVSGLTSQQVEENRELHGNNELSPVETESYVFSCFAFVLLCHHLTLTPPLIRFWEKLKDNLDDPLVKILCVALVVRLFSFCLGLGEKAGKNALAHCTSVDYAGVGLFWIR